MRTTLSRSRLREGTSGQELPLLLVAFSFLLGGCGGLCLAASTTVAGGAAALKSYLEQFLRSVQLGELAGVDQLSILWNGLRWPLLIILLGSTAFSVLAIGLLSGVRGFLLFFSTAAMAQSLGRKGLLLSGLLTGLCECFYLPVFFLLSALFLRVGLERQRGERGFPDTVTALRSARPTLCGLLLLCGWGVEGWLVPWLLTQGLVGL